MKKIIISLSFLGALLGSNVVSAWEIWASVGVKQWYQTYSPGGGLPAESQAVQLISLTAGGERFFFNISGSKEAKYTNPAYPFASVTYSSGAINLGYMATQDVAFTFGQKMINPSYSIPSYFGSDDQPISGDLQIPLIGSAYSHRFEDSSFSINGNIAYGRTTRTARPAIKTATLAGTKSGDSTYLGYELGASYALTQSFSFNLGYRVEQFDDLVLVNVSGNVLTLSMEKIKVSGATVGFAYKF